MTKCTTLAFSLLYCVRALAQPADKEPEPVAVVELGGAAGRSFKSGPASFGADIAVEFTPVERWLELELGVTPLLARHSREWDTGLLFKKPWTLSKKAELMIGVGPEWVQTRQYSMTTNSIAGEAVVDFMYWPARWKHKFGWFVEPAYEYSFARGHERSVGVSGGLLIAIPKPNR
jgi:hypothetical protein